MKPYCRVMCIVIVMFFVFFSGCQEQSNENGNNQTNTSNGNQHDTQNGFLGDWQVVDTGFVYETWTFYANLSAKNYLIQDDHGERITSVHWFDYTWDNTRLCFSTNGAPDSEDYFSICYSYLFSENETHLRFSHNEIVIMNLMKIQED